MIGRAQWPSTLTQAAARGVEASELRMRARVACFVGLGQVAAPVATRCATPTPNPVRLVPSSRQRDAPNDTHDGQCDCRGRGQEAKEPVRYGEHHNGTSEKHPRGLPNRVSSSELQHAAMVLPALPCGR